MLVQSPHQEYREPPRDQSKSSLRLSHSFGECWFASKSHADTMIAKRNVRFENGPASRNCNSSTSCTCVGDLSGVHVVRGSSDAVGLNGSVRSTPGIALSKISSSAFVAGLIGVGSITFRGCTNKSTPDAAEASWWYSLVHSRFSHCNRNDSPERSGIMSRVARPVVVF